MALTASFARAHLFVLGTNFLFSTNAYADPFPKEARYDSVNPRLVGSIRYSRKKHAVQHLHGTRNDTSILQKKTTQTKSERNPTTPIAKWHRPTKQELIDELAASRKKYGNDDPHTAAALEALSLNREIRGDDAARLSLLKEALAIRKRSGAMPSEAYTQAFQQAGSIIFTKGAEYAQDLEQIGGLYLRHTCANVSPASPPGGKYTLMNGMTYDEGIKIWNEIVSLNSSYLGPQHSTTLRNQGLLDVLISRADKFEEAEAAVKLSLSASEWNSLPPDKPTTLYSSLEKLEKMYAGRFDILGHERILKCKLDYLDRCAPGDPALATVLTDYSNLLFRTGRFDQAKQLAERAATFKPRMGV